ncbi:YopX family protein [Lactiplantibacillus plantarum]|uniref:YopX family protein n=1 Tax=Lactiplantibacillus plantarum TaxID=1590 RepID=UPI0021CB1497|nr:YopX family protein [Lactiplantibacillus plantarum]
MIKFRAWNGYRKLMADYVSAIQNGDTQGTPSSVNVIVNGKNETWDIKNDDVKLLQFTGLKDVNGQDVYEDGIIQYSHQFYEDLFTGAIGRETGYIGTVVKNNGAFGILINRMSYTDAHCNYYHAKDFVPFCEFDDPESDMELKGNVHENPELLEREK